MDAQNVSVVSSSSLYLYILLADRSLSVSTSTYDVIGGHFSGNEVRKIICKGEILADLTFVNCQFRNDLQVYTTVEN